MSGWIQSPLELEGNIVRLISLQEEHIIELAELARDKSIWRHYAVDGSNSATIRSSLRAALLDRDRGLQFPFVIYHQADKKIIGSTRFLELQPMHRKLEIGWTWLHPDYWGTLANTECKLLLLTYCFERLKTVRVQFKTDVTNKRSQQAIQKIGGMYEGIFRNDMIRENGTLRHSVYYSIIQDDWPVVRQNLDRLLQLE